MENAEHSKAYIDFFHQLDAYGMEKAYGGFAPDTLDRIYDWERDEVEKAIYMKFQFSGDGDLAFLVAKLQKYDGVEALNKQLRAGLAVSEYSMRMAFIAGAAYDATWIEDYLDYIFEFYDSKKDFSILSFLSYLKPCDKIYEFFKAVYLNSDDFTSRSVAIDGLFCCKGYIKDPKNPAERSELSGMARALLSDDPELRKKKLIRFENGEFDSVPRTYGGYQAVSYEESIRMALEKQNQQEEPGEMVTGIIEATESDTYIVYYEPENTYKAAKLSEDLYIKPSVGDKVTFLMKERGQSLIIRIKS